LKIALVSPYDFTWPGGVTAHISQLSQQLIIMGHQVKVMTPFTPARADSIDQNLVQFGRTVPIPMGGSIARISLSVWLYRKVREFLTKEAFDIVHIHEPLTPFLPLAVLQSSKSVNIGTFHSNHGTDRWYRFSSPILKYWFKRLDGRIAVSDVAHNQVGRFFPGDYQIIPNGIDLGFFGGRVNKIPKYDDGKTNILFVGRSEKRKGVKYLIDAYSQIKWDFPNTRLIVVGPGHPDREVARIVAERGLMDVEFEGPVSHSELPMYYHAADIFCSPATGKESFGYVLLEAMAAGKPIIASDIDGYSSIVQHDHQGLLVPPKNGKLLADSLALLIKNPELAKRMGETGKNDVERYSWSRVASSVLDYYQLTLESTIGRTT